MGITQLIEAGKESRKVLLLIVCVALFLDNMLLTTVVPIMPEYLIRLEHPNDTHLLPGSEPREEKVEFTTTTEPPTTFAGPPLVRLNDIARQYGVKSDLIGYGYVPVEYNKSGAPDYNEPSEDERKTGAADGMVDEVAVKAQEHNLITTENVRVGLMFGSKAIVQLLVNPFIGAITNRVGYTIPMFSGFVIMFLSTIMFAFGESYSSLFLARMMQGVGSACTSTSGMGMLAVRYPDDQERGAAMGVALGGLALGLLIGPPYGGLLYQYSGKELPFIVLALLALVDGMLQFIVLKPKVEPQCNEATSIKVLLKDPYIDVAAGAITIGNMGIAMLEPSLPLWMMEKMHSNSAELGAAFLPASISYLVGTNIFGPLAHRIGRWLSALIGLIIIGCCLLAIPSATSLSGLIIPNGFMGFAIGMIDASMFPQMGYLVDIRHVGVYGNIYAITDTAFCLAFAIGPYVSGPIVRALGFPTLMYMIAVVNFLYAPALLMLRRPPQTIPSEKQELVAEDELSRSYSENLHENGAAPNSIANDYAAYDYYEHY